MRAALLFVALVLAGCLGGAQPQPQPESEPTALDRSIVVRARGYHEANLHLEANDTIAYRWNASAAIDWDLHSHDEDGVQTWVEGTQKLAEGEFTAPVAGIYSLFFHHGQPFPIHVTYHVEGAFEVESISG